MSRSFDFELSEKDYTSFELRGLLGVLFRVSIAVALIVVFDVAIGGIFSGVERGLLAAAAGIGVVVATIILFVFSFQSARRTYRETPSMREPSHVEFDDEGFHIVQHSATLKMPWHDVNCWNLDDRALTLWLNTTLLVLVPRRYLSENVSQAIRELLEATGLPKNKWRKRR